MRILLLLTFSAAVALCQQPSRTLQFTQLKTPTQLAEAATVMRSIGEIKDLSVDAAQGTLTFQGDQGQVELVNWLMPKLDHVAGATPVAEQPQLDLGTANQENRIVRVFYFKNPAPVQTYQQLSTVIRSVTEIRRAFLSLTAGAFIARGTPDQIAAAALLFEALDRPSFVATTTQFRMPDPEGEDTIRLFSFTKYNTSEELNRFTTELRSTTKIKRVFQYSPLQVIVMRSTPAQIAQAEAFINSH